MHQITLIEPDPEIAEILKDAIHDINPELVVSYFSSLEQFSDDIAETDILVQNQSTVNGAFNKVKFSKTISLFIYSIKKGDDSEVHPVVHFSLSEPVSVSHVQQSLTDLALSVLKK